MIDNRWRDRLTAVIAPELDMIAAFTVRLKPDTTY